MAQWKDEATGYDIKDELFYGVGDSGSMYCANFQTREAAMEFLMKHHELKLDEISVEPGELGDAIVVLMTGEQYFLELRKRGLINEFGKWID